MYTRLINLLLQLAIVLLALAAAWRIFVRGEWDIVFAGLTFIISLVASVVLLYWCLQLLMLYFNRTLKKQVRVLYADLRTIYSSDHVYAIVALDDSPDVDRAYLLEMTAVLAGRGFTVLADIDDRTQSRVYPEMPTYERYMRSSDGMVTARIRSFRSVQEHRKPVAQRSWKHSMYFRTRLTDGVTLLTQFPDGLPMVECPMHFMEEIPWAAGLETLLTRHLQRVAEYSLAHLEAVPVPIFDSDELIAALRVSQGILNADRQAKGILTVDELSRFIDQLTEGMPAVKRRTRESHIKRMSAALEQIRQENDAVPEHRSVSQKA